MMLKQTDKFIWEGYAHFDETTAVVYIDATVKGAAAAGVFIGLMEHKDDTGAAELAYFVDYDGKTKRHTKDGEKLADGHVYSVLKALDAVKGEKLADEIDALLEKTWKL